MTWGMVWSQVPLRSFSEQVDTMNGEAKESDGKTALERYRIIMGYLQYENSIFWQRGHFFFLTSGALFGFVLSKLPLLTENSSWEIVGTTLIMSIAGLSLCYYWKRALDAGDFWVAHWHHILRDQLEPLAFPDDVRVFREFKPESGDPHRVEARLAARGPLYLFSILWILLVLLSCCAIGYRLCSHR